MELPEELLILIFNFLDYDDLLVVRTIDETWNNIVLKILSTKTVLINDFQPDDILVHRFYHTNQLVDIGGALLLGHSITNFRINSYVHSKIKQLIIYNPRVIENMSNFDSLIHFELFVKTSTKRSRSEQVLFSLPNVETIYFDIRVNTQKYILNTPKLRKFRTNLTFESCKLMYPETIEELMANSNQFFQHNFTRLKVFRCIHFFANSKCFDSLRSLKEFHFYNWSNGNGSMEDLNNFLDDLDMVNEARVFYKGFENFDLLNNPELRNIGMRSLEDDDLETLDNFGDLNESLFQTELRLRDLDQHSTNIIDKLTNLKVLIISYKMSDHQKWIQLLKISPLTEIKIECKLDQQFLQSIPIYCPFLTKLKITHCSNLDFIFGLKHLRVLSTSDFFEFHFFRTLLINFKYLKEININFYKIDIQQDRIIWRCDNLDKLDEPKKIFLQTIHLIDDWSQLLISFF